MSWGREVDTNKCRVEERLDRRRHGYKGRVEEGTSLGMRSTLYFMRIAYGVGRTLAQESSASVLEEVIYRLRIILSAVPSTRSCR